MSERDPFHDSKRRGHPCDHAISSRADRLAAERERFEEWYVTASELHTEDDRTAAMLGWLAASGLSVLRRKVEPHEDREREATERDEHQDTYP